MTSIVELVHELAGDFTQDILMLGCSDEQIKMFENKHGLTVPDDLKDLYSQSEGEHHGWGGLEGPAGIMAGFRFIPLREIAGEIEILKSISEYLSSDSDSFNICSIPKHKVQLGFYIDGWFPFAGDADGSYLAVDMAPGSEGNVGQVVVIGNTDEYYVIADSVTEFLSLLISKYKDKKWSERFFEYKQSAPHSDRSLTSWLEKKYK